MIHVKDKPMT